MIEKKERKPLTGKLKARLIAIIAVAAVVVIGSVTVTYGWFLSRGSSHYGFVLKSDDHVILRFENDLNFANGGTSDDAANTLVPAVAAWHVGLDNTVYEPLDMFDTTKVERPASAAHFHSKAAYWAGSATDKGELSITLSAFVKGGSSAYDLVEWGEIDYVAIFSYLWDGEDASKKVMYFNGEWYVNADNTNPFITLPAALYEDAETENWYVLTDETKVKVVQGIKYLFMTPNHEFELDLYTFPAKTDELLDPAINGKTLSLTATIGDMTAFVDNGDNTIKFGSYPQTLVVNSQIERKLTALAGELPPENLSTEQTTFGEWTADRDYTRGANYMWYTDVVFRGERYRGIYLIKYRSSYDFAGTSANNDGTSQDDNGYALLTVYWFKFQPIQWRILSEEDGNRFLLSELILDWQSYNAYYRKDPNDVYWNTSPEAPEGTYMNNYKYSMIRPWLNGRFYNTAFSEDQKALILTTVVDNSAESMNPTSNPNYVSGKTVACEDTEDKVFLLSMFEVTTADYGFSRNIASSDSARRKQCTDYAKSQGVYPDDDFTYKNTWTWWLRSPYSWSKVAARVYATGMCSHYHAYETYKFDGIAPALKLSVS